MDKVSLAGWTAGAAVPPLEIQRKERRLIWWNAIRDRARYSRVPLGQATGWTRGQHAKYAGIALALRRQLELHEAALELERAELQAELGAPKAPLPPPSPRPNGGARELHEWSVQRRQQLRASATQQAQESARRKAVARLAVIETEIARLGPEFRTLLELCESAYLARIEAYNRHRYSRADRNVTEVHPGPSFDGPDWGPRQPHLISIQSRSA